MADVAAISNSFSAISGSILRSSPTIPPTKALMITSRVNCLQFSLSPSCMCSMKYGCFYKIRFLKCFLGNGAELIYGEKALV